MKSNHVFVLNPDRTPSNLVSPGKARKLLSEGRAAIFRTYPFTLILKQKNLDPVKSYEVKIDPGSKTTGFAILQDSNVLWAGELSHRGAIIKDSLLSRSVKRRNRRNRKTRYRKWRQHARPEGWLAPSLMHRVQTVMTWVNRFMRYCKVSSIAMELVRFDTQKMENPEISGVEYQQGELLGYEVREYLLEKWHRKCTYCSAENVPLQIEHIHPRSKGGTNRVSNLCLACEKCNQKKGNKDIKDFLKAQPEKLKAILSKAKAPLRDAAAVNSTRWKLYQALCELRIPLKVGSGSRTKFNRAKFELPKTHWIDAACVGEMEEKIKVYTDKPLIIVAKGQGGRQKMLSNEYGYCRKHDHLGRAFKKPDGTVAGHLPLKPIEGWCNGDIAKFKGKIGKVTPRTKGSFAFTVLGEKKPISIARSKISELKPVHRKDGYNYQA